LLEVECEPAVDALELLPTIEGVREVTLYGTLLHVLVADDVPPDELRARLDAAGVHVEAVRPSRPTLEDVFVSRIRGVS
jgi:hypothetical protein